MTVRKLAHSFLLLLTAAIWGFAFVAQSVGTEYVGPFTFNCLRSLIGGSVLIPVIMFTNKKKNRKKTKANDNVIIGGICCGLCLFGGMTLQQIGIQYTTAGKAGFITTCYIVLVPVVSFLLLKKKCSTSTWIGVVLAIIGLYMLCIKSGFAISKGDMYVMLCAVMYTFHILVIDYFNTKADPIKMSCVQFFVVGAISAVFMFRFEAWNMNIIIHAWKPILYAGIISTGVGYTLQIIGQKGLNPTAASLIMSSESVFSVIGGRLLLGEEFSKRELIGCVLMLSAILLAQIPSKSK